MSDIKQIKRFVGNYRDEKCPECKHEYQTGSQTEMNMPYCGDCGKIVLDATQNFCCWCGCKFGVGTSETASLITTIESLQEKNSELEMEMVLTERVVTKKEEMLKDVENRISEVIDSRDKALDEIESQKEEIEKQEEIIEQYTKVMNDRKIEFDSLKAITELAVKGLKKISMHGAVYRYKIVEGIADDYLEQIERLQNAPT